MKKLFLALLCCIATSSVFAQMPMGGMGMGRGSMDPEKMAARQADEIKKKCKIDDAQYEKLKGLFMRQSEEMRKQFEQSTNGNGGGMGNFNMRDMEKMQKQMQDRQEAQKDSIKAILTADQFKKYEKMQKQQQNRMSAGRGRMMRGGGGFGGGMMMGGGGF